QWNRGESLGAAERSAAFDGGSDEWRHARAGRNRSGRLAHRAARPARSTAASPSVGEGLHRQKCPNDRTKTRALALARTPSYPRFEAASSMCTGIGAFAAAGGERAMNAKQVLRTRGAIFVGLLVVAAAVAGVFLSRSSAGAAEHPQLTALALSPSRVQLSWSGSSAGGDTRYRVFRNGLRVGTTAQTSFTDSRLRAGTPYRYSVRVVAAGGKGSTSTPAAVTTPPKSSGPVYPLKVGP